MKQLIKIGLWTIISIVILFLGISYLKGISVMGSTHTYYVSMPDVKGIHVASRIYINGFNVGTVRSMQYDYRHNGQTILQLSLDKNVCLPKGTTISTTQTLLTGALLNLLIPSETTQAYLAPGDTIPLAPSDTQKGFAQVENEIVPHVAQLIARLDTTVSHMNQILSDPNIQPAIADVRSSAGNLKSITHQLQGSLAELPRIVGQAEHAMGNIDRFSGQLDSLQLRQTLLNLETTSAELKQFTQRLNNDNSSVGRLINEDGLYLRIDSMTQSIDALIQDIKANPKRYIKLSVF